jgi:hypothetical protein
MSFTAIRRRLSPAGHAAAVSGRGPGGRAARAAHAAKRLVFGILLGGLAVLCAACGHGGDHPVDVVKAARFTPDSGVSVGETLARYGLFSDPVWETYVDEQQRTIVRFAAQYDVARGRAQCPPAGPEVRPAARVFVTLVYFLQGDGNVSLLEMTIDAYSAAGYSARYLAEASSVPRIASGQPCVACMALFLPASL